MKRKRKRTLSILIVLEVSQIGGGFTAVEELANNFSRRGHEVVVLHGLDRNGKEWSSKHLLRGVKTVSYKVDFRGNFRVYLSILSGIRSSMKKLLKEYKFDLVILNNSLSAGFVSLFPELRKVKKTLLFHNDDRKLMKSMVFGSCLGKLMAIFKTLPFYSLICLTHKVALKRCDYIICFSRHLYNEVKDELKGNTSKLINIPLGVDFNFFVPLKGDVRSLKEKLGFSGESRLVFCASAFEPRKGIDLLLESFKDVLKLEPKAYLVLASPVNDYSLSSSYFKKLIEIISTFNISHRVQMVFDLSRVDLLKYYQLADIVVFPSAKLETFGLVVLEAMSCGIPAICYSKAGGTPEIVSQLSPDHVFRRYKPRTLAKKIIWAINKRERGTEEKAREIAKKYSWKKTAKGILELVK